MPNCDFNKIAKITLRHGCSPVNLLHIFRTAFLKNTSGWMLLQTLSVIRRQNFQGIISALTHLFLHCVKSVQIRSFFWSLYSHIRTEYEEIFCTFTYSVRMRENTGQKKFRIWTLFMQ